MRHWNEEQRSTTTSLPWPLVAALFVGLAGCSWYWLSIHLDQQQHRTATSRQAELKFEPQPASARFHLAPPGLRGTVVYTGWQWTPEDPASPMTSEIGISVHKIRATSGTTLGAEQPEDRTHTFSVPANQNIPGRPVLS